MVMCTVHFKLGMMIKQVAICLGVLLCAALLVDAQATQVWLAWLYNPADGRMTLVGDDGKVYQAFNLPLPDGYPYHPFKATVSQSGTRIAYVAGDGSAARWARVYDVNARKLTADYPLSEANTVFDDTHSFNENVSAVAFGFRRSAAVWQITIVDLSTGLTTLFLRSGSPQTSHLPTEGTPVVQQYAAATVIFTLVNTTGETSGEMGSYTWDLRTNTVAVNTPHPAPDADFFAPTGEIVLTVSDQDFPYQGGSFGYAQANALYAYTPAFGAFFPFYTLPNRSFYFPRFVQNGARILSATIDANGVSSWLLLERDGTLAGEWLPPEGSVVSSVMGTADGFIYTADTIRSGHTTLLWVNTQDGLTTGAPVWSSAANAYPRLMWLRDSRMLSTLPGALDWSPLR